MSREIKTIYPNMGPAPFDTMGLFTFLRTYARRHDENDPHSTVETWAETLQRVVESCNSQLKVGFTDDEKRDVYKLLYNLKCSVAGRFMWQLGTRTVDNLGLPSLQNCSFVTVDDPVRPFTWTMNFLMLGCVPPDTPILAEKGIIPICDINVGDKVWSYNINNREKELKTVTHVHNPIVPTDLNIKLGCRYGSILSSKKHPILVRREGAWNYVLAGDIRKGDIVQKFSYSEVEPEFIRDAWFAGAFLGDGSSNIIESCGSRRIRFTKNEENITRYFAEVVSILSRENVVYKKIDEPRYNVDMWSMEKTLHRDNPLTKDWENIVGVLPSSKAKVTDIPEWIKSTRNKNVFMSFLVGLVDTDGYVSRNKVSISTVSEKLYTSLKQYSSLFGLYPWGRVETSQKHNTDREKRGGSGFAAKSDIYVVTYRSRDFVQYVDFFKNTDKKNVLSDDLFCERQKQYSRKELIIPKDLINSEIERLGLTKAQSYHFKKKIEKSGFVGSGYYESRKVSFDHLLKFDMVVDIEDHLDIDENWKDITVEDNNNYYSGERSFYCTHNCGVGYRLLPEDVDQLPIVKYALITRKDTKDADFIVPDSREGWIKLLAKVLKAHFYSGQGFTYSCTLLRSKGAPIRSFGGVASGPDVLCDGMDKISNVLNKRVGQKVRPIDALDIMNIIGLIVVSGNVRRSAQIAIGSVNDKEFLQAKRWDLGNIPNWRAFSNNSVVCNDINEVIDNKDFWLGYEGTGEPYGLINLKLAKSCGRLGETIYPDPELEGFNPCAEQGLANFETCCLAEIYLPNISSKEELITSASYLYRICKHSLTLPCVDSKETERIVHRNMRMGIGVSGYLQATEEQRSWLSDCYKSLREFDKEYSRKNGFQTSIKLTTVKPSGTLSILANCTPGIHPGFSRFYKRRVRIASESPLIALAKEHGYPVEFVQNFDGSKDHSTQIVTFPMKLPPHTIFAEHCTAIQQLEWVQKAQREWSDNSVSVTVYYRKNELADIKEWLKKNYNTGIKTVSFLLHSEHGFLQAPMEQISEEEYNKLVLQCRQITDLEGVCYDAEDAEVLANDKECAGGVCPRK